MDLLRTRATSMEKRNSELKVGLQLFLTTQLGNHELAPADGKKFHGMIRKSIHLGASK